MPSSDPLVIVGLHHRSAPAELRQRFAMIEDDLDGALEALRQAGLGEAVLVATCDRVELVTHDPRAAKIFAPAIAPRAALGPEAVTAALHSFEGEAALRHLFAVASALDSTIIGEPHVLGQLRAAHRVAGDMGLVGSGLEGVFIAAFACARRVRRETPIADRPQSIAAAALDLARGIHGDLDRCAALLIGPTEMGELMAEQFRRAGLARLVVCGPAERAQPAALRLASNHAPLDELEAALVPADIVISALATGRTVLSAPMLAAALRKRPVRPIFVIDAALPADADPAINALDGVFLYDLADLERAAIAGRARQAEAVAAAWRIVEDELAAVRARSEARRAVPAVVALRRHFERLRAEVMAERGLDADAATRLLVNRLLHAPSEALRDLAVREGDAAGGEAMVRRLFRLDDEEDEG